MSNLVRVEFYVFAPHSQPETAAERYAKRWAGENVTAEPTEVVGEWKITGLFPREFAEAREYK